MARKNYYLIQNEKESGIIVTTYVATSREKAIAFLKKMFKAESNGAVIMGAEKPVDTTDDGFFFYNGKGDYKGGEWKIETAFRTF